MLWSDADGDTAQQALKTTLHRLRRLLRHQQTLGINDGRLSLNPRYCWVDVWHLKRHLDEALSWVRETHGSASPRDLAALTRTLLDAYRGPFLGQDPEPWALEARNRLHDRYLRGLDGLAARWETREDWVLARACYERGLDVESTWERGYQGLLRCHDRLGQSE